ncbi:MAG: DUF2267 domain-containing protein [Candidatus Limnocylindria bacterium]
MDQLIRMVQDKANIDEGQAKSAIDTVVGFLKEKLPDPIAGQIDGVISGSGEGSGSPMDKVGSMFGGDR